MHCYLNIHLHYYLLLKYTAVFQKKVNISKKCLSKRMVTALMHVNDLSLTSSSITLNLNSRYIKERKWTFRKASLKSLLKPTAIKKVPSFLKASTEIDAVTAAPGFTAVLSQRYGGLLASFLKLFRCGKLAAAVETGGVMRKMRCQSCRKQLKLVIFSNGY